MEKNEDPYEVLGLTWDADEAAIRTAYRKLAFRYHPDRQANVKPNQRQEMTKKQLEEANERFVKINDAYSVLTDPVKRYDWRMKQESTTDNRSRSSGSTPSSTTTSPPSTTSYPRTYRTAPPPPPPPPPPRQQSASSPRQSPSLRRKSVRRPQMKRSVSTPSRTMRTRRSSTSTSSSQASSPTSSPPKQPQSTRPSIRRSLSTPRSRRRKTINSSYSLTPKIKEDMTSPKKAPSPSPGRRSSRYSWMNSRSSSSRVSLADPQSAPTRSSMYSSKPGIKEFLGRPPLASPTTPSRRKWMEPKLRRNVSDSPPSITNDNSRHVSPGRRSSQGATKGLRRGRVHSH
eukprot:scaffold5273_cov99-Cylindrotheca_fusiformis.AAC.3